MGIINRAIEGYYKRKTNNAIDKMSDDVGIERAQKKWEKAFGKRMPAGAYHEAERTNSLTPEMMNYKELKESEQARAKKQTSLFRWTDSGKMRK